MSCPFFKIKFQQKTTFENLLTDGIKNHSSCSQTKVSKVAPSAVVVSCFNF